MKKSLLTALFTLVFVIGTFCLFYLLYRDYIEQFPEADNGMLDLSRWDFEGKGAVPLNGKWEFYPNQLLKAEQLHLIQSISTEFINVPTSWEKEMNVYGVATYRLQVVVKDTDQIYGIKTSSIQLSNRIYINGILVGSSGNPDKDNYQSRNNPYVSYLKLNPGVNEILIHVANYENRPSGGIIEPIYLGFHSDISALHERALINDWVGIVAFIIIAIFFLGLYSKRKQETSFFLFALLCFSLALFSMVRGERVLLDVFDALPFWVYASFQKIFTVLSIIFLLLYINSNFRSFCSKRFIKSMQVFGGLLLVVTLLYFDEFLRNIMIAYTNIGLIYALYVLVLASIAREKGSYYLVIAAMALNIYSIVQIFTSYVSIHSYVVVLSSLVFVLMLGLYMSTEYSILFTKVENFSKQLIQMDQLKDEFLSKTSHEFKTPLHGIMNISKSMIEDKEHPLTEKQQDKLQLITNLSNRLSRLVFDILDLSLLKQGEIKIEPIAVDVYSVVEVNIRLVSYLTAGKNIRLMNHVPEELSAVWVDENRFNQMVSNLLDNAVKYTDSGSIEVNAKENNGMIEISVKDTGEGMDEEQLQMIFDLFHSSGSSSHSFGLGLPIVQQLVQLHEGEILVSSHKGIGSTFTLVLPKADEPARVGIEEVSLSAQKQNELYFETPYYSQTDGNYIVLIADDNLYNLKILIDLLEAINCYVIAVKDGNEAIEELKKNSRIDLAILDLMMPGKTGIEVCQWIRQKYTLLELPVLIVTAGGQVNDKIVALETGANDILIKPFDMGELRSRISGLLVMKQSLEKAIDLEIAFLQSQIKPHFLYNVLNAVYALSYKDVNKARELIIQFSDYLRGSFQFSNLEKRISLKQELQLIKTYVEIEKARFGERLEVEYYIVESAYYLTIPPLLIQPLIENAIRHGIGPKVEGGTVKLTIQHTESEYLIIIEDNGMGMSPEQVESCLHESTSTNKGVGLININRRLKYEYGTEIVIESRKEVGTIITMQVPIS